jgi:hypothetical protein
MRHPEQRLWDWLRDRLQGQWFSERIENRVMAGTPDVYFSHRRGRGWIELKAIDNWPRADTGKFKVPLWTPNQRNWMEKHLEHGGNAWLVVGIEHTGELLVLPDSVALQAVDRWTQDEIRLLCRNVGLLQEKRKIGPQALLDALKPK